DGLSEGGTACLGRACREDNHANENSDRRQCPSRDDSQKGAADLSRGYESQWSHWHGDDRSADQEGRYPVGLARDEQRCGPRPGDSRNRRGEPVAVPAGVAERATGDGAHEYRGFFRTLAIAYITARVRPILVGTPPAEITSGCRPGAFTTRLSL